MTLIFFHVPDSTSTLTQAVLGELGVVHQRVTLDIEAGDTRDPAFRAINPNGRVPVIIHDGVPIWEAAAITMYLGETFGVAAGLYPKAGPQRGEAMKWLVWASATLAVAAGGLAAALPTGSPGAVQAGSVDWVPAEQRAPGAEARARTAVAECLSVLDAGLVGRDFLLGDFSLADTHLHGLVGWVAWMDVDLTRWSRLGAWSARCAARPTAISAA